MRNDDDRRHLALEVVNNEGLQPLRDVLSGEDAPANERGEARGAGERERARAGRKERAEGRARASARSAEGRARARERGVRGEGRAENLYCRVHECVRGTRGAWRAVESGGERQREKARVCEQASKRRRARESERGKILDSPARGYLRARRRSACIPPETPHPTPQNPTPQTLNPTPYTEIHLAPKYALNPTLNPEPYTPNSTPYTLTHISPWFECDFTPLTYRPVGDGRGVRRNGKITETTHAGARGRSCMCDFTPLTYCDSPPGRRAYPGCFRIRSS